MNKTSEKFKNARASLPENLRPIYDDMVNQYAFHTTRLFGRGYVAYEVLASLVRDGWRPAAEPLVEPKPSKQENK